MTAEGWRTAIDAAQLGALVATWIYVWIAGKHKATKKITDDHERRLTIMESTTRAFPTSAAVHELSIAIARLSGNFETVGAKLDGLEKLVKRIEVTVNRQEEYLLNKGGRA